MFTLRVHSQTKSLYISSVSTIILISLLEPTLPSYRHQGNLASSKALPPERFLRDQFLDRFSDDPQTTLSTNFHRHNHWPLPQTITTITLLTLLIRIGRVYLPVQLLIFWSLKIPLPGSHRNWKWGEPIIWSLWHTSRSWPSPPREEKKNFRFQPDNGAQQSTSKRRRLSWCQLKYIQMCLIQNYHH